MEDLILISTISFDGVVAIFLPLVVFPSIDTIVKGYFRETVTNEIFAGRPFAPVFKGNNRAGTSEIELFWAYIIKQITLH